MSAWKHLRAIAVLPFMGAVVAPAVILAASDLGIPGWGIEGGASVLPAILGVVLVATGIALLWRTIVLLARLGEGTLAPWDPTTNLVVAGPYRFVRNPMITGVALILLGEAAIFGSLPLLAWAALFLAVNALWFPFVEEPALARRFGDAYREYAKNVPRWVPRRRPWDPPPRRAGTSSGRG
jgi:protein-S-isoprenylcysteine O-methyltransferase Ste14